MYKNIIFDCADTLLAFDGIKRLTEELGDAARAKRIHATIYTSPLWLDYDRGRIQKSDIAAAVLPQLSAEDRAIGAAYLDRFLDCFSVIDGTPELLLDLKARGCKLYVLSDFSSPFDYFKEKFDFFSLFDALVISCEHGVSKYDHGLFPRLLEVCDLDPADCFFFDDRAENIAAAATFGIAGKVYTGIDSVREALGI